MKKLIALLLVLCVMMSFCCLSTAEEENPWSHLDLSEYMEINFFFPCVERADYQEVKALVDERMKELINTKVNITFVSFGEYATKLSLFLAGDEDVDLCYGAYWLNFMDYAKNGAYKGFDWDFVEKYMPMSAKYQAPTSWREVKYDDLYYGVPSNRVEIGYHGIWTRQSLLDKYGFKAEDIKHDKDLERYMDAIAADSATTGIYAINPQNNLPHDTNYWFGHKHHLWEVNVGNGNWMVWRYDQGKEFALDDLLWFAETPEYREFCLQMAEHYKRGYFPAGVMSNTTNVGDAFIAGTSATIMAGPQNYESYVAQIPDDTPVYINCLWDENMKTRKGNYLNYVVGFTPASKKMERAAVALDVMKFDPQINMWLTGGIEGRHYTLTEDGKYFIPGPEADDFPWNHIANNAALKNDSHPAQLIHESLRKYTEMYKAAEVPSDTFPVNGFNYDCQYVDELSAINALFNELRFSFAFGIFGDQTEAKLDDFIAQAKAIGIDDLCADYRKQLGEFIEANK